MSGSVRHRALVRDIVASVQHRVSAHRLLAEALDDLQLTSSCVRILAVGKVAVAQASVLSTLLEGRGVEVRSAIAVTKFEDSGKFAGEVLRGDHPVPGAGSMRAGTRLIAHASQPDRGAVDRIFCISGGGSSLACIPAPDLAHDYHTIHDALHRSSLPIEQINEVRSAISALKNGGLAQTCLSQRIHTLVTVDVPTRDPAAVASGPTISRTLDPELVTRVLHDVLPELPSEQRSAPLFATDRRPHPDHHVHVLADDRLLTETLRESIGRHGIGDLVDANPEGTASSGPLDQLLPGILEQTEAALAGEGPVAIAWTGEFTHDLTATAGVGGRCSAFLAAMATRLFGTERSDRERLLLLAIASDGEDGTTGTSGGFLDSHTFDQGRSLLGDEAFDEAIRDQDSGRLLQRLGISIEGGAFQTNLMDLYAVLRLPGSS